MNIRNQEKEISQTFVTEGRKVSHVNPYNIQHPRLRNSSLPDEHEGVTIQE